MTSKTLNYAGVYCRSRWSSPVAAGRKGKKKRWDEREKRRHRLLLLVVVAHTSPRVLLLRRSCWWGSPDKRRETTTLSGSGWLLAVVSGCNAASLLTLTSRCWLELHGTLERRRGSEEQGGRQGGGRRLGREGGASSPLIAGKLEGRGAADFLERRGRE